MKVPTRGTQRLVAARGASPRTYAWALLAACAALLFSRRCDARPVAYVASDSTVTVVETATNTIAETILTRESDQGSIVDIAIHPDGNVAYLVFYDSIGVLDLATNHVTTVIPTGAVVSRVAFTPDGAQAYIMGSDNVQIIDTKTRSVVTIIPLRGELGDLAITPDGTTAYVSAPLDAEGPGAVFVIDTATRRLTTTIRMPAGASSIAITPDGGHAYVTTRASVAVIDTATNAVASVIPLSSLVNDIAFSPDGRIAYVSAAGTRGSTVSTIETATQAVRDTVTLSAPVFRIALSPDGAKLYVVHTGAQPSCFLTVIDTATMRVANTIEAVGAVAVAFADVAPPPTATPTPVPATPSGSPHPARVCAYLTHFNLNSVSVIDTTTDTIVGRVPITEPKQVAMSADGSRAYVTSLTNNGATGSLSLIDTATNEVAMTIPVFAGPPIDVAAPKTGTVAYLTLDSMCYQAAAIDTQSGRVTNLLPGGNRSYARLAVTPDGSAAYLARSNERQVLVIDLRQNSLSADIPLETQVYGIAINPAGTLAYVAGFAFKDDAGYPQDPAPVVVIDTASQEITANVLLSTGSQDIGFTPDGRFAYVPVSSSDGRVAVIDTATSTAIDSIAVGSYPYGVAITPDGTRAYVTNFASKSVSVIDTNTRTVIHEIALPDGAEDIAIGLVPDGCGALAPPTPTFTPTPPHGSGCVGDCDGTGSVTVEEVIKAVNIALGSLSLSTCESIDANGDGSVTVDEVVLAVSNALNGCPTS